MCRFCKAGLSEVRSDGLQLGQEAALFLPCQYAVLCMQAKRDRGQDSADEAATKRPRVEEPVQEQAAQHEAPQQAPAEEPQPQPAQAPTVQHVTPQVCVTRLSCKPTLVSTPVISKHPSGEALKL